jgi:LmbE family N-acetylglucosaminyl deacetylase
MLKLLCVTAHPDDEAGCFGGILSKYSEAGVACSVICLTAGERAANRGGLVEDEALKAVRRQEFADSCHLLGVAHCEVLDFADGALDHEDFAQAAGKLVHILRTLRPHVVVTFAADGYLTAHPDHGMVGMFTAAAFQWAARSNRYTAQLKDAHLQDGLTPWQAKKLYCVTAEFSLPERPVVSLAPVTARVSVVPYLHRKLEAFALHKTQHPLQKVFAHAQRQAGGHELFHLAATAEITPMQMETDLFAGIREL